MIRPRSSPCSRGLVVCGRSTSFPLRICGAMTMKMMSSTSTTSTSGVTLIADWIRCALTGRMDRPRDRLRSLEQDVHDLGRGLVHLDLEAIELTRELVERYDSRDRDEDAERRRDQRVRDAAGDRGHAAGARGRDALESVDDPDHRAEEADEGSRGADRRQEAEAALQLDDRLLLGMINGAPDEIE